MFQPTGLAYVAAALEGEHEVLVFDACAESRDGARLIDGKWHLGLPFDAIQARIREVKPDAVGISIAYSVNAYAGLRTAEAVKQVDRAIHTVLGGPHPSINAEATAAHPDVDFVVVNEGERTAPELFRALAAGADRRDMTRIAGIAFKIDQRIMVTPPRPLIDELDSLRFPARHLLPMELYHRAASLGVKSRALYNIDMGDKQYYYNDRSTSIISSRGCPFHCNFCSINLTMGYKFRKRTPSNVLAELDQCVRDYGIQHFDFEDDNLTFDKNRIRNICDGIVESGHQFTWSTPNGIRADIIDEDLVIRMKKSGCRRVFVAPESGVQAVVDEIIEKNMRLSAVTNAVRLFAKHGVYIDASFVIGSVGKNGRVETKREILGTILFALKLRMLGLAKAGFNISTPLLGTSLRADAEKYGYLRAEAADATEDNKGKPVIETPEFSNRDLIMLQSIGSFLVNYTMAERLRGLWNHRRDFYRYLRFAPSMLLQAVSTSLEARRQTIQDKQKKVLETATHV